MTPNDAADVRDALGGRARYTKSDVVRLTGISKSKFKQLARQVVRVSGRHTFTLDDLVRFAVGDALVRLARVQMASIRELFRALEMPTTNRAGHTWSWLRTTDAVYQGSALVIFVPPQGTARVGAVMLTTAAEAKALLQSGREVLVLDIGAIVTEVERQTGESYATNLFGHAAGAATERVQ